MTTEQEQPDMLVMHAGNAQPVAPGQLFRRKLPGHAWKRNDGEIIFIRGTVVHAGWGKLGSSTQFIETDSKLVGCAQLIGHNYIYWCPRCSLTIYEQEMLITNQVRSARVDKQRCMFCEGPILPVQPGAKVRLHYRFAANAAWGGWWAEVWEW